VIYDPYFCAGAVKRHLAALGFTSVINECEDFYARAAAGLPAHDVLLTNPAYSGDHIPRLLDICCASGKPFLLLMPNWVAAKGYYAAAQARHAVLRDALYWWPQKRYVYWTPQGFRSKKQAHASAAGNRTSPFPTFWYLGLGPHRAAAAAALRALRGGPACGLAEAVGELPAGVRPAEAGGGGGGGGGSGGGGSGSSGGFGGGSGGAKGATHKHEQGWHKGKPKDEQQHPHKAKQQHKQQPKQQHKRRSRHLDDQQLYAKAARLE
jgi:hypothetical protein